MTPVRRLSVFGLLLLLLGSLVLSCGESEGDVIYVYAFNGYSGGGKLSVFSSAGQIADGLEFGQSTETPLALDRNRFDGNLTMLISGGQAQEVTFDAFAFYPNESVTIAVTRKTGQSSYEFRVLRHHILTDGGPASEPNSSPYKCVIEMYNAFSLSNNFTGGDQRYNMATEWLFEDLKDVTGAGNLLVGNPVKLSLPGQPIPTNYDAYIYEGGSFLNDPSGAGYTLPTECGEESLSSYANPVKDVIIGQRTLQLQTIQASPWLYLVNDPNAQNGGLTWRWGQWAAFAGGTIDGIASTSEFRECAAGAVTYSTTKMVGDKECPDPAGASIDLNAFEACTQRRPYQALTLNPGAAAGQIIYFNPFDRNSNTCSGAFRLRTRAVDSIFDAENGNYVQVTFNNPAYQWQYMLMYGSPFNPGVHFLKPEELKQDLRAIDNPGGVRFQGTRSAAAAGN